MTGGLAMALTMPSLAADGPAFVAPAAIRDALQSAWQHHPTYRVTEAELAAARARLEAAGQPLYNPEVEVSYDEDPDHTATTGLSLTLDLSGKRGVRRDAASARLDQSIAEARLRRRDFVKQWFTGWAGLQTAQQRENTGERVLALVTRFVDLAEQQFAAEDISALERDLALLARDEAQAEQSSLVAEKAEAEARFRALGGNPQVLANLTLPTGSLPPAVNPDIDLEELPDLQAAQAAAIAAQREVDVAQRDRNPDPTARAFGGRKRYEIGGANDTVFGVSISIPLHVRNTYSAEVTAAQSEAQAAQAEVDRVRVELDADRHRSIETYSITLAAWKRWQLSRGTDIERRNNLLERLWREGELTTSDYLLQLKQTLNTALAGAELEARLWRSYADFLAATGQLERWSGLDGAP